MPTVLVSGAFDDLRSRDVRLLEEAAGLGRVTVGLWTDDLVRAREKRPPKFPFEERFYLLQAIRHVTDVVPFGDLPPAGPPGQRPGNGPGLRSILDGLKPQICVTDEKRPWPELMACCDDLGIEVRGLAPDVISSFPPPPPLAIDEGSGRPRVVVTGCYDWFHSGHVRFFEEVSAYGDLYVIVGHDANIRLLKGEGRPLFPQEERRYVVGSIRFVTQALISSGDGWLDADPEIQQIQPDIYAVNEDGDQGGKREYCTKHGIEYLVLQRTPAPGLPRRSSTDLRGF
jgi:cytidyltransferase-like protein